MPSFRLVAIAVFAVSCAASAEEGPFDARMKDHKSALTAGGGSSGKGGTEEAVLAGLRWLARHQSENGSWSSSGFQKLCPEKTPCAGTGAGQYDTGLTALVLLAFAGAGKTDLDKEEYVDPVTGKTMCWGTTVHNGLTWLMDGQGPDGCFVKNKGAQYMYNHMVAAAAMAEIFAMTKNAAWEKSARLGLDFTLAAQNPGAGWRYTSRSGDSDASATAWGVTSLMAARAAGFEFDKKSFADALAWVDGATDEKTFKTGYNGKGTGKVVMIGKNDKFDDHPTMTGAGLVIRIGSGAKKTDAVISGG